MRHISIVITGFLLFLLAPVARAMGVQEETLFPSSNGALVTVGNSGAMDAVSCGIRLATRAGLDEVQAQATALLIARNSVRRDTQFIRLLMAVAYVESRMQPGAVSGKQARGLVQVTAPAALHAAERCQLGHVDALSITNPVMNIRYGSCYLDLALEHTGGSMLQALIMYNGGYRQLTALLIGDKVAAESTDYAVKVLAALETCQ